MSINTGRVVLAGLAAGIVANITGFLLFGLWLGPRFQSEMAAAAPSLPTDVTGTALGWTIAGGFVVGFVAAWLYAAMRPRFGAGAKTALYAALVVWILGFIFHIDMLIYGLLSTGTYMLASVAALGQIIPTAYVAGMLYKEGAAVQ